MRKLSHIIQKKRPGAPDQEIPTPDMGDETDKLGISPEDDDFFEGEEGE